MRCSGCAVACIAGILTGVFLEQHAHGLSRETFHISQLNGFVRQQAHTPMVMTCRYFASAHGDQAGLLFVTEQAPATARVLLLFVREDRFNASRVEPLADIAHGLL